jgi:nuclear pore complex protein Nup98-Nup96
LVINIENDVHSKQMQRVVSDGHGFTTSIDLMNSLFGQDHGRSEKSQTATKGKGNGFEV